MATSPNITSHVLPRIKTIYPDHIYNSHPTLVKLIEKGERQNGGLDTIVNRIATKDSASTRFLGTTMAAVVSSASQSSALLPATFYWTNLITAMTLTYDERLRAGDSEFTIIQMSEAKKKQAELMHMNDLAQDVLNATGTSTYPFGLAVLIDPAATFGGVVPGADTDYISRTVTAATNFTGKSTLENAYTACLWNDRKPDWCPTTAALWSRAANIFGSDIHYTDNGKEASRGLDSLKFRGMEIYLDRDMAASQLWMLNSETIHLYQSTLAFKKVTTFDVPTAGADIWLGQIGHILSSYILMADERRVHGGYSLLSA